MRSHVRPYIALFIKGVLVVSLAFAFAVLIGLHKENREQINVLQARLDSISARTPVDLLEESVPETSSAGDPYLLASEVLSLEELPSKDDDGQFRYLVVEVSGEGDLSRRVSFKMKVPLVTDFLKRSLAGGVFR